MVELYIFTNKMAVKLTGVWLAEAAEAALGKMRVIYTDFKCEMGAVYTGVGVN